MDGDIIVLDEINTDLRIMPAIMQLTSLVIAPRSARELAVANP